MASLDRLACRDHLERTAETATRDLRATEVSLVSRVCLGPLDHLETRDLLEMMEPLANLESPDHVGRLAWMEMLVSLE